MALYFSHSGHVCGINTTNSSPEDYEKIRELDELYEEIANTPGNGLEHINATSMLNKLWLSLLPTTEPRYSRLRHNTKTTSFTSETIANYRNNIHSFDKGTLFSEIRNPEIFNISIAHIRRGLDIFDLIKDNTNVFGLKPMPGIQMHLTQDRYHKIAVYETDYGVLILTNQLPDGLVIKAMSCLWSQYTARGINTALQGQTPETNEFLKLCSIIYNNDVEAYKLLLENMLTRLTANQNDPARLEQELLAFQERISENTGVTIRNNISRAKNELEQLEGDLISTQNRLRNHEMELIRFEYLNERENKAMKAMLDMIKRSNGIIELIGTDPTNSARLIFDITTPINSYRIKDVEVFFKPNANRNMFTKDSQVALAIRKTFIEEEYQFMTKTRVALDFTGQGATTGKLNIPRNPFLQNTHIHRYNCFSNAKTAANKAILNQDYISALAQLIMACGTLTFTDGLVMTYFADLLIGSKNKKWFLCKATNELMSVNDIWNKENPGETPEPNNEPTVDPAIFEANTVEAAF